MICFAGMGSPIPHLSINVEAHDPASGPVGCFVQVDLNPCAAQLAKGVDCVCACHSGTNHGDARKGEGAEGTEDQCKPDHYFDNLKETETISRLSDYPII